MPSPILFATAECRLAFSRPMCDRRSLASMTHFPLR